MVTLMQPDAALLVLLSGLSVNGWPPHQWLAAAPLRQLCRCCHLTAAPTLRSLPGTRTARCCASPRLRPLGSGGELSPALLPPPAASCALLCRWHASLPCPAGCSG